MPEEIVRSTESIVAGALKDADLPTDPNEIVSDADEVHEVPEAEVEEVEGEKPVVEAKDGEKKVVDPDADDDPELTKLMEEYGIKRPTKEQKDNRIPYSRQRKIIGKMVKGIHAKHQADIAAKDKTAADVAARIRDFEAADNLSKTDPDRYIATLAVLYPDKYQRFTKAEAKAEIKEVVAASKEPIPGPDLKYSDGTVGYSPEQLDKRDEWLVNKAKADTIAALEGRLAPIEKERQARDFQAETAPKIATLLNRMKDLWGDMFVEEYKKDKDSEILKVMTAEKISLEAACTKVLLPRKLAAAQSDKEKLRAEILDEMEKKGAKRAAAASKITPSQTKREESGDEERSTEDVVRAAMAAAGMK